MIKFLDDHWWTFGCDNDASCDDYGGDDDEEDDDDDDVEDDDNYDYR